MPSTSRRRLLGGVAALAGGTYGANRLYRGRADAEFGTWEPEPGTWPLARYDPANTAHNPNASPPRAPPEKRELASVPAAGRTYLRPLVGGEATALYGSSLTVYGARGDPTRETGEARFAGFGPDGVLHAARRDGPDTHLVGYAGGEERYRHPVPDGASGLTVGATEVYVGTDARELLAYHPGDGHEWTVGGTAPALADGRLYAAAALRDGALAYRERGGTDRWLSIGPERVWGTDGVPGETNPPAVADGRLTVGTFGIHDGGRFGAFDARTGEALWEPKRLGSGATAVSTPAVAGRAGYVAAGIDGLSAGFVARYDLETGAEVWRDDTDWFAYGPALAGDTLVVAGDVRTGGKAPARVVRAYDAASGEVLWTVTFPGDGGTNVALVGDRVLATAGASLYGLA
jgi:outer membrane protein assembly factor BamB